MFDKDQLLHLSASLAAFCHRIDALPNVDPHKISFTLPLEICGHTVIIEETPTSVTLKYPDFDHVFMTKPNGEVLTAAVNAFMHTAAKEQKTKTAQTLVASMADKGYVYVQDMSSEVVDCFLEMWSDAYGEDKPDMFVRCESNDKTDETFVTGFIKTRLTPADIVARNNEDGDDDYKPEPLFPNVNKIKEDKPHA